MNVFPFKPHLKILAIIFVLHLPVVALSQGPYSVSSYFSLIDVLHYDIDLYFDFETRQLDGEVEIKCLMLSRKEVLQLDLIGLNVDTVRVNDHMTTFVQVDNNLQINLPETISSGDTLCLFIVYNGIPTNSGTGGFFISASSLYTVGQAINRADPGALRYWVPCKDRPDDKATLCMRFESSEENHIVISNGQRVRIEKTDSSRAFVYQHDYPIAPYLVAISVADYESFEQTYISASGDTIPLVHWVFSRNRQKAERDWQMLPDMLSFYESVFGNYPFKSYGMVEIANRGLAMEHQTITSMGGLLITGDKRYEYIVAHELAHQWWGDWVTVADWRDLWLNEGFATYSEALYFEHRNGKNFFKAYMHELAGDYFEETGNYGVFPLYDPKLAWGATTYDKGAWVLHMLRFELGDQLFFRCLQEYGRAYAYGNVVTDDFIRLCEHISGQNLSGFFNQWVFQSGHPEFRISWDFHMTDQGSFLVVLNIGQHQPGEYVFNVPLDVLIVSRQDSINHTLSINSRNNAFSFTTEQEPVEIIVDPQQRLLKEFKIIDTPLPQGIVRNRTSMAQNFPNPFMRGNHQFTTIQFLIEAKASPHSVELIICDIQGREVKRLVDEKLAAGLYTRRWYGKDHSGRPVSAGTYFCSLRVSGVEESKKIVLLH
ncbi:hypothetical protein GF407_00115 [candidate division KSB1 bacterium]|nr:hypothetical protein [candidate division KSB1 bacterium]